MSDTDFAQRLASVLDLLQGGLHRLTESLQDEQTQLRQRDPDGIAGAAQDKLAQVQSVERGSAALTALLAEKGLKPTRTALAACLTTSELQHQWQDIAAHLDACAQLNRINGGVIEVSRNVAERLLGLLRGDANAGGLYSAAGKVQSASRFLPIAKA